MSNDSPTRIYAKTDKMFEFLRETFERDGRKVERVDASHFSNIDTHGHRAHCPDSQGPTAPWWRDGKQ